MYTLLLDATSFCLDILHFLVILVALFGFLIPQHYARWFWSHKALLMIISAGFFALGGKCWLTLLAHKIRKIAHPDEAENIHTFSSQICEHVGIKVDIALMIFAVLALLFILISAYWSNAYRKTRLRKRK